MLHSKLSTVLLALVAMLTLGVSSTALAGTIKGTVTGAAGPAGGVQVRLQKAKETGNTAKAGAKKLAKNAAAAEKPKAPKAGAMTVTTDVQGNFTFENVAAGNYTVVAN